MGGALPIMVMELMPEGAMKFAGFMHRIGSLKTMPASWKDYFFGEIHALPGS
jgi:NitT/TauT family transport system substrate-binding protein